jgi:IS4 transposase
MRALDEMRVLYTIPAPKNQRIKREIARMRDEVKVIKEFVRHGPVADGRTMQPAHTNLILLPSTKDPEATVAFTTNQDVQSVQEAKGQVMRYSRRWGIENSYKTIKDFLAWTTSKEFVVRFFYFGFAVLLYNMWLLVDLLVQLSLDVEHRYQPRVTAKRFLNLARKQLAEPG